MSPRPQLLNFSSGLKSVSGGDYPYDTHELYDTHALYEEPGVGMKLGGEVPVISDIREIIPQIGFIY